MPEDDALDLILDLSDHALLEVWSTGDDGLPRLELGELDRKNDLVLVRTDRWLGGVWPAHQYEERADRLAASSNGDGDAILRALLLCGAAAVLRADALVTGADVLLEPRRREARRGNPMPAADAAGLVGLFLRTRGDFTIGHVPGHPMPAGELRRLSRWLYYWVLARELLPSAWRWFGASVSASQQPACQDLDLLAGSALVRVDRALQVRDRLHEQCQLPPDERITDEALFQLDCLALLLDGAFDVVARVAHRIYNLAGSERDVGWRRQWLARKLKPAADELADLMREGQPGRDLVELIGLLRNTIHGEALRAVTAHSGGRQDELVTLPASERAEFLAIVARQGGQDEWGVRPAGPADFYLEPDTFVERLIPSAIEMLDRLMAETEVERLPGVGPAISAAGPPEDEYFSSAVRQRVRLLGGFG